MWPRWHDALRAGSLPIPTLPHLQIAARVLASSCIAPLTSAQLEELNDELASKTVLVGSHVTLADLALYSAAEPALV